MVEQQVVGAPADRLGIARHRHLGSPAVGGRDEDHVPVHDGCMDCNVAAAVRDSPRRRRAWEIGDACHEGESSESGEWVQIVAAVHGEKTICGHADEGEETKGL